MKIKIILVGLIANCIGLAAQETYNLKIEIPLYEFPQNSELPYSYPSMNQSLEWSHGLYEFGFLGIDKLGDLIFKPGADSYSKFKNLGNNIFKYAAGLAFAKYGSELPIPLGVWAHEEFHRSVLGVRNVSSLNGNWIFNRWDGTVYGVSDVTLSTLKLNDTRHLLYSYVSGVQYEVLLNEKITLDDFYSKKTFSKGPLALHNAYYVWDYFRFASSSASDSAKILSPPHEDASPSERDFAGSDLNSWVYDMFNPEVPFIFGRDAFPGGTGLNRRIGFSDLAPQEQDYLKEQKNLSLLNFINPSIFLINRIKLSDNFSFSFFARYAPLHFGNVISVFLPFKTSNTGYLINIHKYSNYSSEGYGIGGGLYNLKTFDKLASDIRVDIWDQPISFFGTTREKGGSVILKMKYMFNKSLSAFVQGGYKTRGWLMGNPYLNENFSVGTGISFYILD
ncbi:MAG TPA: hypothetical protein VHO50_02935 [Bacteroidales bacterium]|nr:hypothetical protein [Bacteroidales bacterium]